MNTIEPYTMDCSQEVNEENSSNDNLLQEQNLMLDEVSEKIEEMAQVRELDRLHLVHESDVVKDLATDLKSKVLKYHFQLDDHHIDLNRFFHDVRPIMRRNRKIARDFYEFIHEELENDPLQLEEEVVDLLYFFRQLFVSTPSLEDGEPFLHFSQFKIEETDVQLKRSRPIMKITDKTIGERVALTKTDNFTDGIISTKKEADQLLERLKQETNYGEANGNLMKFLMVKENFKETILNMFHLSFLLKENKIKLEEEQDDIGVSPTTENDPIEISGETAIAFCFSGADYEKMVKKINFEN
ncbi:hypothetical protein SNEBB_008349 [Seison nebaliae]|nr:hypothetical protein SNEBB_008349 [Seison nebaliae]